MLVKVSIIVFNDLGSGQGPEWKGARIKTGTESSLVVGLSDDSGYEKNLLRAKTLPSILPEQLALSRGRGKINATGEKSLAA
jgi:hypothetical protein